MFNPYNLVFTFFLKENLKNVPITKDKRNNLIILFNSWVKEIFSETLFLTESKNHIVTKRVFKKLLDIENTIELTENENKLIERVLSKCENEEFIDFDIKNLYDVSSAKRIYYFFKKHFDIYKIDPFSFTDKKLTTEEKMSFLHNNIE